MDEDGPFGVSMRKALELGIVTPAQWMRMMGIEAPSPPMHLDMDEATKQAWDAALARLGEPSEAERQIWQALREKWQDETDR